jgi:hypothetical protein
MTTDTALKETMGLCIACEAIDDIANHALLEMRPVTGRGDESEVYFRTLEHQQLFLIRLQDLAKENTDQAITGVKGSCIDVLNSACATKFFDFRGSIGSLQEPTGRLQTWLNEEVNLPLWLPTASIKVDLRVPRSKLLFISGNRAKHNISRLSGVSKCMREMLKAHGHEVELAQIPLLLDDLPEQLNEGYFVSQASHLTELLNEVRWGIQEYLLPTFNSSITPVPSKGNQAYEYQHSAFVDEVPRQWFWRLMGHIRSRPRIPRFKAPT